MIDRALVPWESRLAETAREFKYPPTPNLAGAFRRRRERPSLVPARRLAWAAALVVLIASALMSVRPIRAAVLEVLRIGVVRIFVAPPTATPAPTATSAGTISPATASPSPTARPTAGEPSPLLSLSGETTLELARQKAGFEIPLPTYPEDLGEPDHVYLQDQEGSVVFLVWTEADDPEKVRLSLHLLAAGTWGVQKFEPQVIEETMVNGLKAVWTTGPYVVMLRNNTMEVTAMIGGHVLIWFDGSVTHRLETDESLLEAVRIAESLQ